MKNILITGGAGFIGSNLANKFLKNITDEDAKIQLGLSKALLINDFTILHSPYYTDIIKKNIWFKI